MLNPSQPSAMLYYHFNYQVFRKYMSRLVFPVTPIYVKTIIPKLCTESLRARTDSKLAPVHINQTNKNIFNIVLIPRQLNCTQMLYR
jgi:hypothetical protein